MTRPHLALSPALASEETRAQLLERLLSDRAYHIEFNGFLTNHVKHAVIALERIGAADDRLQDYFTQYAAETPYGFGLEPARASLKTIHEGNWLDQRGLRSNFEGLRSFRERSVSGYAADVGTRDSL